MMKIKETLIFFVLIILMVNNINLNADECLLAIVNDEVITSKDLTDFINFMRLTWSREGGEQEIDEQLKAMESELLNKLIEDRIILQEAKRQKINIDKNILAGKINEIKKRYPTDKDFQMALISQGLNMADIEKRITEQLLIYNALEKNVRNKIVVHPEEVNLFFQKHTDEFIEPEKREIFVFVFDNILDAENIRQEFKKGLIEKILNDVSLNKKDLGVVERGQLRKEFDEFAFTLKENESSDVLKVDDKYYIFFIKKIHPSRRKSFSEVKHRIYEILFEKKMQEKLEGWLNELRKKSYIQIRKD
ncbi:MAG: peptidyl-prolyl cis-trans isomerase [Candidatus Omnitrophica bacterium]|nr:peptidyl-prolyl cis-trans isomerase [Candidatus Omnitrophota bacterium]